MHQDLVSLLHLVTPCGLPLPGAGVTMLKPSGFPPAVSSERLARSVQGEGEAVPKARPRRATGGTPRPVLSLAARSRGPEGSRKNKSAAQKPQFVSLTAKGPWIILRPAIVGRWLPGPCACS